MAAKDLTAIIAFMNKQKTENYFLAVLLLIVFVLSFYIFKPFLYALILAVVFATIFLPIHRRILLLTKNSKTLSAIISTLLILIVVIVPLSFVGFQLFQEATNLYGFLAVRNQTGDFSSVINSVILSLKNILPASVDLSFDINHYLESILSWFVDNMGSIFANVAKITMSIFIFLLAMYYLFRDMVGFKQAIVSLSPLQDVHDEEIFRKLTLAVNSVIRGSLTVAIVQGILTAVGFLIFQVPNPTLWGAVAAIAALIPGLGTSLVVVPGILFLLLVGDTGLAIGLFIWGALAVGLVDNFLGPKLVGRGTSLHPFLVLLSILGGIGFFGPIGFILGPLVLSLLFALLEIYLSISRKTQA